jgi:hypothetical protein
MSCSSLLCHTLSTTIRLGAKVNPSALKLFLWYSITARKVWLTQDLRIFYILIFLNIDGLINFYATLKQYKRKKNLHHRSAEDVK